MWNWDIAMCTAYPTNWNIKMSYLLEAKVCLKQVKWSRKRVCTMSKVPKWSDMWTSCRILLCVIQNNPPPAHPFQYTQVLSVNLTDRMDVSVHPVQSHASLCHCLLHVHTKTVDELICVCVLASLLFGFCFFLFFRFWLFVSLCLCDGVENWCCKPKKNCTTAT